jgi:uncharacterized protein (TIGR02453 family)
MSTPCFTPATLSFLRALKRNNNRDWFKARRERYERDVREPMLRVIERLAVDFKKVAPELVASPKASMYRIYRDTRFSGDKTPLKTNVSAVFPWRGLARHQGAGLYFEVAPTWVWIGGGMYAPEPAHLVKVREHIAETFPEIRTLSHNRTFVKMFGGLGGETLTRVPRGYAKDHPAADFLRHKQFLAGRELPAEVAARDDFYAELVATFKAAMPLIRFLNEPLVG